MEARLSEREPAVRNVGVWVRVSTEDQANGESADHHERRARMYAEARGWRVLEVYRLEAVSGKSVMPHPETQRMLQDMRSGHISALIFSKLARLARNTKELLEFADLFRAKEADLVSLQEAIDTSTPAGRLFYTVIAAMAQWEREEIASRVAASVPIRAKLGKPLGGAAPFGYRWENRLLVPDPTEAPIRRRLYELFVKHRRKKTVARLLNEAGFRTRNGSLFSDTTVSRLIQDPTAKGRRRANYTRSLGERKHWTLKPEAEWVFSDVEPVVSDDLWNAANAILAARKGSRKPGRKPVHLFAGVVVCACGTKMYVFSNSPKYICKACLNKVEIGALEEVFRDQLQGFVFSEERILEHLTAADEEIQAKERLLSTLRAEASGVAARMRKTMDLYIEGGLTVDGFKQVYGPLEARSKALGDEIPRLQGELDFLKIRYLSRGGLLADARSLYGSWEKLTAEEKRAIVETIVERITVGKDEIHIDLCFLPASAESTGTRQHGHRGSSTRRARTRRGRSPARAGARS